MKFAGTYKQCDAVDAEKIEEHLQLELSALLVKACSGSIAVRSTASACSSIATVDLHKCGKERVERCSS